MSTETEWILYQIGSAEPNKYRFIITRGFQDMAVTGALKPFEFIDTTATLLGELGGDVTVLGFDELLGALRKAIATAEVRADLTERTYGARPTESWLADARAAVNAVLGKV